MSRILDGAGRELIGYTDPWSTVAGQRVELMVSTTEPTFDVRLVRLRHGDPNPAGPGFRATGVPSAVDGTYPGAVQAIRCGSYAVIEDGAASRTLGAWAWPTRPDAGREQVLLQRGGLTVLIGADGRPCARAGDLEVRGERLARERWVRLTAVLGEDRLSLTVGDDTFGADGACAAAAGPIHLAADADGGRCYDGKLEEPFADRDVGPARGAPRERPHRRRRRTPVPRTTPPTSAPRPTSMPPSTSTPTTWRTRAGSRPARFRCRTTSRRASTPSSSPRATSPTTCRSSSGPPTGRPSAPVALLLPTLTYQVYGNERLVAGGEGGMAPTAGREFALDPADHWLAAHPEAGASCYDLHPDGHGVSLVSMLRPIPNLRPSFVWWVTEAPERFGSDLYVVDWLEELGQPHDVFTDHDLHADGAALLDGYRVLITGTHPEYWSREMLDALQGWLERRRPAHVPRRQRLLLGHEHRSRPAPPGRGAPRHQRHARLVVTPGRAARTRPPASRAACGATAAATPTGWSASASRRNATPPTARRAIAGPRPATTTSTRGSSRASTPR